MHTGAVCGATVADPKPDLEALLSAFSLDERAGRRDARGFLKSFFTPVDVGGNKHFLFSGFLGDTADAWLCCDVLLHALSDLSTFFLAGDVCNLDCIFLGVALGGPFVFSSICLVTSAHLLLGLLFWITGLMRRSNLSLVAGGGSKRLSRGFASFEGLLKAGRDCRLSELPLFTCSRLNFLHLAGALFAPLAVTLDSALLLAETGVECVIEVLLVISYCLLFSIDMGIELLTSKVLFNCSELVCSADSVTGSPGQEVLCNWSESSADSFIQNPMAVVWDSPQFIKA